MSEIKFTPGPWGMKLYRGGWTNQILGKSGVRVAVASMTKSKNLMRIDEHGYPSEKEVEANARLIAAAPEMYELLRMGLEDGDPMNWDKVSELLDKINSYDRSH